MRINDTYSFFIHPLSQKHSSGGKFLALTTVIACTVFSAGTFLIPFFVLRACEKGTQGNKAAVVGSQILHQARPALRDLSTYNLEQEIETVKKIAHDGRTKLCLFVGRTIDERLPEAQGREKWISLDLFLTSKEALRAFSAQFGASKDIATDRLHLRVDLDEKEQVLKLKNLFDKIVVDESVIKFIHSDNPWADIGVMLKRSKSAELIAEAYNLDSGAKLAPFFEDVQYVKGLYPYETTYSDKPTNYFVLCGPKS